MGLALSMVIDFRISSETVLGDAFHRRDGPAHEELHYLLKKLDLPVCRL